MLLGLDDRRCEACRQKFLSVAGDPRATGDVALSSSEFVRIHAGVLGLCALVDSVPYTVPAWVPETVAALARYANDRSADVIRTTVQKCLQDFLRTHQEAWEEVSLEASPDLAVQSAVFRSTATSAGVVQRST